MYQMAVNNAAMYIRQHVGGTQENLTAFEFSTIMAVLFCKAKEEILSDILQAQKEAAKEEEEG